MRHDVVFSHATVVDGTGSPAYRADVAVDGERITAIGEAGSMRQDGAIDASSLILSPGFIDFHSHADFILATEGQEQLLDPFLHQGVTTFAGGNCGFSPFPVDASSRDLVKQNSMFLLPQGFSFSWETMDEFITKVEESGTLINVALLTGHGSLRALIKGNSPSPMTREEKDRLASLIHEVKLQGAIGISLGLFYIPSMFADVDELETVFAAAAKDDLLVTIHGHTYSWTSPFYEDDNIPHNVRDVELFCNLALKTGAKVHLSHLILKGSQTWNTLPQVLDTINHALTEGANISFGVIPYHWGNTLIKTLLPAWFLEDFEKNLADPAAVKRLGQELEITERAIGRDNDDIILLWGGETDILKPYEGKSFKHIAKETSLGDMDTILWIIKESKGSARILTASYSGKENVFDEPLYRLMKHDRAYFEIDAIVTDTLGPQTPAAYGAFPRILGRYSREQKLFSLEEAVHRITGKSARRLGLVDRGLVRVGAYADLVLFDAKTIKEGDILGSGSGEPSGIKQVWINGNLVLEHGTRKSALRNGRIMRSGT